MLSISVLLVGSHTSDQCERAVACSKAPCTRPPFVPFCKTELTFFQSRNCDRNVAGWHVDVGDFVEHLMRQVSRQTADPLVGIHDCAIEFVLRAVLRLSNDVRT